MEARGLSADAPARISRRRSVSVQNFLSYISTTAVSALPLARSAPPRLNFVVAVHGLQGRLRLAIARPGLGPRGLCPPPCRFPVWGRGARPPAGPSAAHATPKSSLGAPPSWSCKEGACSSSSRRSPLRLVAVALEEDAALATHPAAPVPPWGRQAPAGVPPCAPRHLRRAPGSRRAVACGSIV